MRASLKTSARDTFHPRDGEGSDEAGIQVTRFGRDGFPECLDGRVKTLHPMIHAGILAVRSNPEHMAQLEKLGVTPIDIVAINLYPFKQTVLKEGVTREEVIENIDIGGPTMIRAAAKNWQDVAVIVDPEDYVKVINELKEYGDVTKDTKLKLAYKVLNIPRHMIRLLPLTSAVIRFARFPDSFTMTFDKSAGYA